MCCLHDAQVTFAANLEMVTSQSLQPSIGEVKSYWEKYPLLSHELGDTDPHEYWRLLDLVKRSDIDRFTGPFWDFGSCRNKQLLDIGCGPGWLTVNYALAGAHVTAVDLTMSAIGITESVLTARSLDAAVYVGDAEQLPFSDACFD